MSGHWHDDEYDPFCPCLDVDIVNRWREEADMRRDAMRDESRRPRLARVAG